MFLYVCSLVHDMFGLRRVQGTKNEICFTYFTICCGLVTEFKGEPVSGQLMARRSKTSRSNLEIIESESQGSKAGV